MKRLAIIVPVAIALAPFGLVAQLAFITWKAINRLRGDHS